MFTSSGVELAIVALAWIASVATWALRPGLRQNRVLRGALAISTVVLVIEVALLTLFLISLSTLPDMRDF